MKTLLAITLLLAAPAAAAPRTYTLPEEAVPALPQGANADLAAGNCGVCHSTDYITTQPRNPATAKAFWQAEVVKMRAAYGAPLDDADIPKIVDYLTANYGK